MNEVQRAKQRRSIRQGRREALERLGSSPMIPRSVDDSDPDAMELTTRPDLPRYLGSEVLEDDTLLGIHLLLRVLLIVVVTWAVADLGFSVWHVLK